MKNPSGTNPSLFFNVSIPAGLNSMTIAKTNPISKNAAPQREPNGINAVVDEELEPATIAVMISGAPLANARKVTPAKA